MASNDLSNDLMMSEEVIDVERSEFVGVVALSRPYEVGQHGTEAGDIRVRLADVSRCCAGDRHGLEQFPNERDVDVLARHL